MGRQESVRLVKGRLLIDVELLTMATRPGKHRSDERTHQVQNNVTDSLCKSNCWSSELVN